MLIGLRRIGNWLEMRVSFQRNYLFPYLHTLAQHEPAKCRCRSRIEVRSETALHSDALLQPVPARNSIRWNKKSDIQKC
jgi:hypothetical protein